MPDAVNLYDAKTHLSALVDRAAAGEEIVIAKAGRPVARLVPLQAATTAPRAPAGALGLVEGVPDRFFDPLPDAVLRAFTARD